jgi:hypothetical protein
MIADGGDIDAPFMARKVVNALLEAQKETAELKTANQQLASSNAALETENQELKRERNAFRRAHFEEAERREQLESTVETLDRELKQHKFIHGSLPSAKQRARKAASQPGGRTGLPVEAQVETIQATLIADEEADLKLPTKLIQNFALTEETPVPAVLHSLAKVADQSIVISEGVTQTVQMHLSNEPWNEVFKSVLLAAGLFYKWDGGVIRVMSLSDMQRELAAERIRQEYRELQLADRPVESLHALMIRVKFGDSEKLGAAIRKILASKEGTADARGSVTIDEDNQTIIVRAIKSDLEKVRQLISQRDRPKR